MGIRFINANFIPVTSEITALKSLASFKSEIELKQRSSRETEKAQMYKRTVKQRKERQPYRKIIPGTLFIRKPRHAMFSSVTLLTPAGSVNSLLRSAFL